MDKALQSSSALLTRARSLTVQGANTGALGSSAREALATELEATAEALREQANAQYLGRSVFAGTSGAGAAFGTAPAYTFTGAQVDIAGEYPTEDKAYPAVLRRVSDNTQVQVDSDGKKVFGTDAWPKIDPITKALVAPSDLGYAEAVPLSPDFATDANLDPVLKEKYAAAVEDVSVFVLLNKIASDLRAGGEVNGYLNAIDARMNSVLKEVAAVGSRYNQTLQAQETIAGNKVTLESQLTDVEDVDLAETIVELKAQEIAYQSALSATTRALQPSLLDFLR